MRSIHFFLSLCKKDPDAALIIAPSDHMVIDNEAFQNLSLQALDFSKHMKAFVTLGIQPTYPNTGYGYIQYEQIPVAANIYKVKTFTEKPNLALAKTFISSGDFLWNSGIFYMAGKKYF